MTERDYDREVKRLRDRVDALERTVGRLRDPVLIAAGMRLMVVTTRITPMVGSVYGGGGANGRAVGAVRDRTAKTIGEGSGDPEDVLNYHEKGFQVGALIAVGAWDGAQWAHDVGKCADYR